jgi:endo-1,4-beta-mannosidase
MAHFAVITSGKTGSLEYVNLDLVRHATQDGEGRVTLIFDSDYQMMLNQGDSKMIMEEIMKTVGSAF